MGGTTRDETSPFVIRVFAAHAVSAVPLPNVESTEESRLLVEALHAAARSVSQPGCSLAGCVNFSRFMLHSARGEGGVQCVLCEGRGVALVLAGAHPFTAPAPMSRLLSASASFSLPPQPLSFPKLLLVQHIQHHITPTTARAQQTQVPLRPTE